jgi:transcriptional regulator with XRE-family HTH domain
MSVLSERLKELRGTTSQSDMAAALDMKYQQWARYEKGVVAPGADILAKICRTHAVSADWLLGLSEERGTSAASPPPSTINLEELRETATQLADQAAELAGTIKKLKKML